MERHDIKYLSIELNNVHINTLIIYTHTLTTSPLDASTGTLTRGEKPTPHSILVLKRKVKHGRFSWGG